MDIERWKQVDSLLQSVLERRSEDREAFLRQACAGDESLECEVLTPVMEADAPEVQGSLAGKIISDTTLSRSWALANGRGLESARQAPHPDFNHLSAGCCHRPLPLAISHLSWASGGCGPGSLCSAYRRLRPLVSEAYSSRNIARRTVYDHLPSVDVLDRSDTRLASLRSPGAEGLDKLPLSVERRKHRDCLIVAELETPSRLAMLSRSRLCLPRQYSSRDADFSFPISGTALCPGDHKPKLGKRLSPSSR
jgi:hypothetical protein